MPLSIEILDNGIAVNQDITGCPENITFRRAKTVPFLAPKSRNILCSGCKCNGICTPDIGANLFIYAAHYAYANHRTLKLRPDDLWLNILQGLSIHFTLFPDLVAPIAAKKQANIVVVSRNDFILGYSANNWAEFIRELSAQLWSNDFIAYNLFDFSTSNDETRVATAASLAAIVAESTTFKLEANCGIPRIELLGNIDDYTKLYYRVRELKKYGLGWYADICAPIIAEIIRAFSGESPNEQFWKCFYKFRDHGDGLVQGWINVFFPYIYKDGQWTRNTFLYGWQSNSNKSMGNPIAAFPAGFTCVEIDWEESGEPQYKHELVSGFLSIDVRNSVSPHIGWVVRKK